MRGLKRVKCYECGNEETKVITKNETLLVRGEDIEIESQIRVCVNCGNEIVDEELENDNLKRAYADYRKKFDVIEPEKIREIREKYGISQRSLGKILGWGEITIHRYETGAVPDLTHNKILKLIEDPEIIKTFVVNSQDKLPKATYARIIENIQMAIDEQNDHQFIELFQEKFKHDEINIECGFKQFDFQKFLNAIVFYAKSVDELWQTKLNKLLFYLDFNYFKKYTLSLTGCKYVNLQYGPVIQSYEAVLWVLEQAGYIRLIPNISGDKTGYLIESLVEFDKDIFAEEELDMMKEVLGRYGQYSSVILTQKSHDEKAWSQTQLLQVIPYSYAADLN